MKESPLIIALDVESAEQARKIVRALGDSAGLYKVGMELYAAAGMDFVRELIGEGKQVFLDQKYFDIPETVKRATAQAAKAGARFLTVHAQSSVVRAAVEGRGDSALQILAVSVLTSFDESDVRMDGYSCTVSDLVELRAKNAIEAGADGIVCSPREVASVRRVVGSGPVLVTPGVRSAGAAAADQKRIATPAEAIRAGADFLVIGRQVTRAADPKAEVGRILEEIPTITATTRV
jgi:orotidine-5'-phosphate decarboxylase